MNVLKKTHFSGGAGAWNNWLPLANNYSSSRLTYTALTQSRQNTPGQPPRTCIKLIVYKNTLMMPQNKIPNRPEFRTLDSRHANDPFIGRLCECHPWDAHPHPSPGPGASWDWPGPFSRCPLHHSDTISTRNVGEFYKRSSEVLKWTHLSRIGLGQSDHSHQISIIGW